MIDTDSDMEGGEYDRNNAVSIKRTLNFSNDCMI